VDVRPSQYFVGLDAGHVVVFRGVKGNIAASTCRRVEERTTLGAAR